MGKGGAIIGMMFAIIIVCLSMVGLAWYFGSEDWTWISQQIVTLLLILITFGIALIGLISVLKRR